MVYVSNLMSGTVSVIDPEKRELKKNIRVGKYPVFSLGYPPGEKKILVTLHNYEKKEGGGRLLLVDPLRGKIIRKITYRGIAVPSGMVYDIKREVLYVADENLNRIWIHDGRTLELTASLAAGTAPVHADISRDGDHLVVTNRLSSDLSLYNLKRVSGNGGDALITTIPLGGTAGTSCHPYDVKFSAAPSLCCVTDFDAGELLIADIVGQRVTHRIRLGSRSFGLALDSTREKVYVCNMGSGSISVIRLDKRERVGEITGLCTPCHCVFDERGGQLVVSDQGGAAGPGVHFIDLATEQIVRTISDKMIRSPIGVTLGV
ncbi:MAG: YncE family protein [Methanoregula sp.]|nr:YncE family protein [Methanoregula sp.]